MTTDVADLVADVDVGIGADPWNAPPHMERDARAALSELARRAEAAEQRAEAAEAALAAARAEVAQARAEGEAAGAARAMAVVKARLAEVSQHDYLMRSVYGSHDKDREVEINTLQRMLQRIEAGEHVAPAAGGAQ